MKKETKIKRKRLRNQKQGAEPRWVGQVRKIGWSRDDKDWIRIWSSRHQILTKVKYLTLKKFCNK